MILLAGNFCSHEAILLETTRGSSYRDVRPLTAKRYKEKPVSPVKQPMKARA